MIVYEFKVKGKEAQYRAIDEAIRTSQFIRKVDGSFPQTEKLSLFEMERT